jgi:hypothetical protein
LHEVLSKCLANFNKKIVNLLLFIDFKEAFDFVNPDLLLLKLCHYGFSNNALELMKNYYFNRQQSIEMDGIISILLLIVTLGVLQGSVLQPIIFISFINDLVYYLEEIYSIFYFHDTTIGSFDVNAEAATR